VRFTVSGLVGGATTNVTVTGPNAFTQTVTTGDATITIGVPEAGIYTVTATASLNVAGVLYTASHAVQSVTVGGASVTAAGSTITYGVMAYRANVTVSGIPSGSATLQFKQSGYPTETRSVTNITNVVTLPAGGTWTITANPITTSTSLVYNDAVLLAGTVALAASGTTVTGTGTSFAAPSAVGSDTLLVSGSSVGTFTNSSTTVNTLTTAVGAGYVAATASVAHVRIASATVTPVLGNTIQNASRTITYVNITPYMAMSATAPTGITLTPSLYAVWSNTDSTAITTFGSFTQTVSSSRANTAGGAGSLLRILPVTVNGVTYGNSAAAATITPTAAGPSVTAAYYAARMSTQFVDGDSATCNPGSGTLKTATVAALAGQAIVLSATGPSPNTATFASRLISGTVINETLPVAGLWALNAPANVVFGGITYRFVPQGSSTLTYASSATARTVSVCLP